MGVWEIYCFCYHLSDQIRPPPPTVFCPLLKKQSIPKTYRLFPTILVADTPLTALLGHPVQTYFIIFCHLIKKSLGNQYLKICDRTQYFFADTPMKFFSRKI